MSLNTGIRAFYRLEEDGTIAAREDHFGFGPDLMPTGGATNTTGRVGDGLLCDGDAGVFSPSDTYFDFSGAVSRTVTGWVNFSSTAGAPGVISNWANSGGVVQWLLYHNGASLAFRYRRASAVENEIQSGIGAISTGQWYFCAFWHNHITDEYGIRVNTTVNTVSDANDLISGATSVMEIGNRNQFVAGTVGTCDSVGFWDRQLSSGELDELYNSGNGLEPPFNVGVVMDNFQLRTGTWNEKSYATRIAARSRVPANTGYVRLSNVTKDDSSAVGTFSQRYCRNYYTLPPSSFWTQYKSRLDLGASRTNVKEDGFRFYERVYKHNQEVFVDGPAVIRDTLIAPEGFVHPQEPKAADTFSYPSSVNLNFLHAEFSWMPTFGCADLLTDMEIARFSFDSNNYIAISLLAGTRDQREYNEGDVYGRHDPTFRLTKVRAGSVTATVDVVAYFGYDLVEPSSEKAEDVLRFTVYHLSDSVMSFRVNRGNAVGEKSSIADLTAIPGSGIGSVTYSGAGYFGPLALFTVGSINGRTVPSGRKALSRRLLPQTKDSVLAGERDPTAGQLITNTPFLSGDTFDRADNPDLGTDWNIIKQTGNGFNIISNKADCVQEGFEYWIRRPQHADVRVEANVVINSTNDIVGLLARLDRDRSDVSAFGAEIIQTGASAASLRVVLWWLGVRTILSTAALSSYTSGVAVKLRFTLTGTTLLAEVLTTPGGVSLASVNPTHDLFMKPGRVGIYGQTGGAGQHVTLDDFLVAPAFKTGVLEV